MLPARLIRALGGNGYTVMLGTLGRPVVLATVSAAVALCILFVDRPLALWLDARSYGTTAFAIGAFVLRPLDSLLIAGAPIDGARNTITPDPSASEPAGRAALGAGADLRFRVCRCGAFDSLVAIGPLTFHA